MFFLHHSFQFIIFIIVQDYLYLSASTGFLVAAFQLQTLCPSPYAPGSLLFALCLSQYLRHPFVYIFCKYFPVEEVNYTVGKTGIVHRVGNHNNGGSFFV